MHIGRGEIHILFAAGIGGVCHQEVEITSRGSSAAFENHSGLVVNIKLVQSSDTSERGVAWLRHGNEI
jgi:hypothetical protein